MFNSTIEPPGLCPATSARILDLIYQILLEIDTEKGSLDSMILFNYLYPLRLLNNEIDKTSGVSGDWNHGYLRNLKLLSDLGTTEYLVEKEKHSNAKNNIVQTIGPMVPKVY